MKSWLGLVLAPSIALGAQSVLYAMVTPACGAQTRLGMHLAAAVALVLVIALALLAFGESSLRWGQPSSPDSDEAQAPVPRRFLADAATAVAGISALVILGMWFAVWVLSPCAP
jgi:cytochrome c-type biogenesis protein CcmH/NrfG